MGNVLIRDVEDHVIDAWKERARQNGGSLQQELKKLVTEHEMGELFKVIGLVTFQIMRTAKWS